MFLIECKFLEAEVGFWKGQVSAQGPQDQVLSTETCLPQRDRGQEVNHKDRRQKNWERGQGYLSWRDKSLLLEREGGEKEAGAIG